MTMHHAPAPLPLDQVEAALAPFGHSRMLPGAAYVDPAVLEWERRHFFDASWVCAGRLADLAAPRAQKAVRAGSTSVLLSRDADGQLHAFANICRHRGHELLACGASTVRGVIQCPYHAWSYELDGSLRLAPHFGDVPNFDQSAMGLVRVAHAEWGGWVFVNVDGQAPPFEEHLGGFADARRGLGVRTPRRRRDPRVRPPGQLEDRHRELPRVLPLPPDPSRAVPCLTQRVRAELRGRAGCLGGW